eukprot:Sspe_Gene.57535::Locus_31570_Transcript_2_8_Confidence_0.667_Length_687::g.57535::m.57535
MLRQVSIPDLHQFAVSAVLDSSATNPYSPNTVDGSLRKMAAGFLRLARVATSPTPPLMTLHGLFDGHGGRQAAEFCKQWMPVAVYFGILSAATEAGGFEGLRSVKTVLTGAPGRREEPR